MKTRTKLTVLHFGKRYQRKRVGMYKNQWLTEFIFSIKTNQVEIGQKRTFHCSGLETESLGLECQDLGIQNGDMLLKRYGQSNMMKEV